MFVRPLDDADQSWKITTLERGWGSTTVVRLGELVDAAGLPGFVATDGAERVGLLTYAQRGNVLEVVTIQSLGPRRRIGRSLMNAARDQAVRHAATHI